MPETARWEEIFFRGRMQEAFRAVLRRQKAGISGFSEEEKGFREAETGPEKAKRASEQLFCLKFRKNLDN